MVFVLDVLFPWNTHLPENSKPCYLIPLRSPLNSHFIRKNFPYYLCKIRDSISLYSKERKGYPSSIIKWVSKISKSVFSQSKELHLISRTKFTSSVLGWVTWSNRGFLCRRFFKKYLKNNTCSQAQWLMLAIPATQEAEIRSRGLQFKAFLEQKASKIPSQQKSCRYTPIIPTI
jgi:hypothetical protein